VSFNLPLERTAFGVRSLSFVRPRMKRLLALLLLLWLVPAFGSAVEPTVLLVNATQTFVSVEVGAGEPVNELLPGESKSVAVRQLRWLRFGQEANRYNLAPVKALAARSTTPLVVQAHPDGRLYILPAGTSGPSQTPPPQPRGFPLKPSRSVDLT
jgi:hypothetical protein